MFKPKVEGALLRHVAHCSRFSTLDRRSKRLHTSGMASSKRLHTARTVRLEREQLAALQRLSKREKRSLGNTIRVLIDEALSARSLGGDAGRAA